ncbi:peptidase M16 [Achromatium sp. WMS1]|nr:peptidase M16 [Achromatium sp. WMS1]
MFRLITIILISIVTIPSKVWAATVMTSTVHEQTLANGLKVIVKEDHRAPIVTSQIWYKVGSSYESDGNTGISHALEHMMFKGTEKYGVSKFCEIITAQGGICNAFTGRDYTAYFQKLANDRLEIVFQMEADRMRNLTLLPSEYTKEIKVVKEERRMRTEDDPMALTIEHFYASAYLVASYRNPIIGWMTDLDTLTIEQLRNWYQQWYSPNNAILVVVGDVEPAAVFALASKYFGPLKAENITPPVLRAEPMQRGMKRITVKAPAKEPYLVMGYKTPKLDPANQNDWEPYALEVLAYILDGGSSARFSRELIRGKQVAASVDAEYNAFSRLPGMLVLDGSPAKGHTIADLELALQTQIARIRTEPVDPAELQRVQQQIVAKKVFEKDSVFYQAMQIGILETVGLNWQIADQYVDRISAVTAEQVQAVAQKYLIDDNLTIAMLDPQPLDSATKPVITHGAQNVVY